MDQRERDAMAAARKIRPDPRPRLPNTIISHIHDPHKRNIIQKMREEAFGNISDDTGHRHHGPVKHVNMMAVENSKLHHTNMFHSVHQLKVPIFRRGQPFSLTIELKHHVQPDGNIRLNLTTGHPSHREKQVSNVQLPVTNESRFSSSENWAVRMISNTGNLMKLEVMIPPTSPIGVWRFAVTIGNTTFSEPKHFYIIFNPWCKDDAVYMENDQEREEFVLNQAGLLYQGSYTSPSAFPWNYNQFFAVTLPAAMCVLEGSPIKTGPFSNPIDVCRSLSYGVNEFVIHGAWFKDQKYPGGVAPWEWTGSQRMLEQFMWHLAQVKYGQCWVYGAIVCSLARALGIPCRVISNFGSGHDANADLVIEYPDKAAYDSYWNFHVWNEGWFLRPDLPDGYGGWQAFDATPQEFSVHGERKVRVCGPASVNAIKEGDVNFPYDGLFIYGEVNADLRHWEIKVTPLPDKREHVDLIKLLYYSTHSVGVLTYTKKAGSNEADNVTGNYKFPTGTPEARYSIRHAAKVSGITLPDEPENQEDEDVFFDLLPLESVQVGVPMRIVVKVENRGGRSFRVSLTMDVESILYTGAPLSYLNISRGTSNDHTYKKQITIQPGQNEMIVVEIPSELYLRYLPVSAHFRMNVSGSVAENKQTWNSMSSFHILKPNLHLEIPSAIHVGKAFTLKLSFKNPTPMELHNCKFRVDANCASKGMEEKFRNVKANEHVTHQVQVTPQYTGPFSIVALFNSDELTQVVGSKHATCS